MIDDREIWACANQLMRQYGADAWFVAAKRADELLIRGQIEGNRTFLRILERITQLGALNPQDLTH